MAAIRRAPLPAVLAAFAIVYVVWGSTYLAIRFAVEAMPPFLLASSRFLAAGALLFAFVRPMNRERVPLSHWGYAAIIGTLMLAGGNGLVCFGEQYMPSGLAALLIATAPFWFILLDWLVYRGPAPNLAVCGGLAVGLLGVYLLVGPESLREQNGKWYGAVALLAAALSWTIGSLQGRRVPRPKSPLLTTAMQMLTAGVVLLAISGALGEWSRFSFAHMTAKAWLSWWYLVLIGAILALTCYVWLLEVATPAHVSTYAYVNPAVAVFCGYMFANEPLTLRMLLGAAAILVAVVVITTFTPRRSARTPEPATRAASEVFVGGAVYTIDSVRSRLAAEGGRYKEFLREPAMSLGVYELAAGAEDPQAPHTEDEVYVVLRGAADIRIADEVRPVAAGSVVYVERGVPHKFVNIREALSTLVLFAPPEGSLSRAPSAATPRSRTTGACHER